MARNSKDTATASPIPATPSLRKSNSSTQSSKNQKSILGFFTKTPSVVASQSPTADGSDSRSTTIPSALSLSKTSGKHRRPSQLTPLPSSDAPEELSDAEDQEAAVIESEQTIGLPSPDASANGDVKGKGGEVATELTAFGTPSRRVCLSLYSHSLC